MQLFHVALLIFYVSTARSLKSLRRLHEDEQPVKTERNTHSQPSNANPIDTKTDLAAKIFQDVRVVDDLENNSGEVFSSEIGSNDDDKYRRNGQNDLNFRRNVAPETRLDLKRMVYSSRSTSGITSSSYETNEFREQWAKRWNILKEDAFSLRNNASLYTNDKFVMVAARPWYTPCGDPNQHDLPWGTCLLNTECEGEYRIYRGDFQCGKTSLVCCAIDKFRNDMNAALDLSFADTSQFSTSSEEIERLARGTRENKRRKRQHKKNLVRITRQRQKRKLKKTVRRLMKEIKKQLSRAFRNNSMKRTVAMINLKKLVKHMKRKYIRDRHKAVRLNDQALINISDEFAKKIFEMRNLNLNFLTNDTFREIVVNGTITKRIARLLLQAKPELGAFPEMKPFLDIPKVINARRSGGRRRNRLKWREHLQYDIMDY